MGAITWEAYLKQAMYTGYFDIGIGSAVFLIGTVITAVIIWSVWNDSHESRNDRIASIIMVTIIWAAIMIFPILSIKSGVLHILNPEYYAIQDIIETLK